MVRGLTIIAFVALLATGCVMPEPAPPPAASAGIAPTQPPVMPSRRPEPRPVRPVLDAEEAASVPPPSLIAPADPRTTPAGTGTALVPVMPEPAAALPPPATATARAPDIVSVDSGLRLVLRAPARLPGAATPLALPVEAKLSNNGHHEVRLSAPTPCEVTRWEILTPAGAIVLAKRADLCAQVIAESALQPGETLITRDNIGIPAAHLRPGPYRLRYVFWGAVAETDLVIE